MAQLAACRRAVGVAPVPDLGVVELRGATSDLRSIATTLGARPPADGACTRIHHGWWQTVSSTRALVLTGIGERVALVATLNGLAPRCPDVAWSDVSEDHAGIVLVGLCAQRLATSAATRLAAPVVLARRGEDLWLVVVPRDRAADARDTLLMAGRAYGAVAIDPRVTELYQAARPRPTETVGDPPLHPTSTGALTS